MPAASDRHSRVTLSSSLARRMKRGSTADRNTISAGPLASRAASAIGIVETLVSYYKLNSPIPEALTATEVALAAAFLRSPLSSGITGSTIYVDKGYNAMGMAVAMPPDFPDLTSRT